MRIGLQFILMMCFAGKIFSQDSLKFLSPAPEFNKKRFVEIAGVHAVGYGGSLVLLSRVWYNDYNQTSFHSFDDGNEWLQMDKVGHFVSAWYLGKIGSDMYQWSGVETHKAVLYGALSGWGYLTGIEILDGFSNGWGFSWSDFSANTLGTGFIIGQKFLRCSGCMSPLKRGVGGISLKFSFSQTQYPKYRPSLLGSTLAENILKDYNGQSYWLSFNISSFLSVESRFPKWLNLAFGYGAEKMISGKPGFIYVDVQGNTIEFERYRQYYISLDIVLTRIKTKSHFLKTVFETISFIKIPAPGLELNKHGVKFHLL